MADYSQFKHAATEYPLTASSADSLLKDVDASLYYMLDFLSSMLTLHIGSRLKYQSQLAGIPIATPVAMKMAIDPGPYLLENQLKFPLLAVYRKTSKFRGNFVHRHDDSEVEIVYVLPPLMPSQAEQIIPILRAVGRVFDNRISMGADPSYTPPGGAAGDSVWGSSYANLERIELYEEEYGLFEGTGSLPFPCWTGKVKLTERSEYIDGAFDTFDGINGTINLVDQDGTTVENVSSFKTYQAPTITAVSPSSGTDAGGTSITLTGTNFRSGAIVMIDGVECTSVNVVSATSITCVTPAHAEGIYDITVSYLNDGQSGTYEAAFTYT